MSSSKPFLLSPLYDVTSSYSVDRLLAETITESTLNIFAPYAYFEMATDKPRPLTFPEHIDELSPQLLRDTITKARLRVIHPVLYTKRPINNADLSIEDDRERIDRQYVTRGINRIFDDSDSFVKDVTILRVDQHLGHNAEASYVGWGLHELGHSFGLMHCTSSCCVMQTQSSAEQIAEFGHGRKKTIFCNEHTFKLDQTMRLLTSIGLYKKKLI